MGIPVSALPPDSSGDHPPGPPPGSPPGDPGDSIRIAELEVQVRMLRDQLTDTKADRDRLAGLLEKALEPRPGFLERIAQLLRR